MLTVLAKGKIKEKESLEDVRNVRKRSPVTENVENVTVKSAGGHIINKQTSERSRIVQYFKDEYAAHSKVPSVRSVCDKFKLDTKSFYKVFPQGKSGVCNSAGIPVDRQSFKRIAKASQALKEKKKKESLDNEELNVLRREKEKIAEEVEQAKMANERARAPEHRPESPVQELEHGWNNHNYQRIFWGSVHSLLPNSDTSMYIQRYH